MCPIRRFISNILKNVFVRHPTYLDPDASINDRVEDLIGRMNVEEKMWQLVQGNIQHVINDEMQLNTSALKPWGTTSAAYMERDPLARLINETQSWMVQETRLKVPTIMQTEGVHGWVDPNATMFTTGIGMGCSFNVDLMHKVGDVIGTESGSIGIHNLFAPVLDLAREPRFGRIEEGYGEDPHLTGEMGKAYVEGMQGGPRPGAPKTAKHRIAAMVKHFVGFASPMGGINQAPVEAGERDMRTIYLPPFKRAIIGGGALSIMSAYHSYDGVPSIIDRHTLTEVLRDEWGFEGFVISDSMATHRLCAAQFICDPSIPLNPEAAILPLNAGNDLELGSGPMYYETIAEQVEKGNLDIEVVNEAVRRLLRVKFYLGLFELPHGGVFNYNDYIHTQEHIDIAQQMDEESIVLLENDGTLPLDEDSLDSVAIIGPQAAVMQYGVYVPPGVFDRGVTPLDGINSLVGDKVEVNYAEGCKLWSLDESGFEEAVEAAENSDVAVVMVGTWTRDQAELWTGYNATTGENRDQNDLGLVGAQLNLVKAIQATGKPTVVVFITGKPTAEPWIKNNVNAIVNAFYLGETGGTALANVLFGKVNPSGKLSISFPNYVGSLPAFYNFPKTGRTINAGKIHENGTMEFGQAYTLDTPEPLWYFGHGNSYTTFEYKSVELSKSQIKQNEKEDIIVTVTIGNTGDRDGKEVVQVYVDDVIASVVVPNKSLRGFAKVDIPAGETRTVDIVIRLEELEVWTMQNKFVLEKGDFALYVGGSYAEPSLNATLTVV
ncbi:beta-glucosidase-related glycosidase [Zychaea mexicana]|uniref:beta-glucosidase-related glycosidase n=1 Tax=Zychaea mexicana TaxID=64656 RepID=UPI0022FDCDB4|nr:beta-glucosidase-related glycosidase [Zychaea mexicana]KAI9497224.1 beta-glucosidase-related glycosidase [Zychaea mexicana]